MSGGKPVRLAAFSATLAIAAPRMACGFPDAIAVNIGSACAISLSAPGIKAPTGIGMGSFETAIARAVPATFFKSDLKAPPNL